MPAFLLGAGPLPAFSPTVCVTTSSLKYPFGLAWLPRKYAPAWLTGAPLILTCSGRTVPELLHRGEGGWKSLLELTHCPGLSDACHSCFSDISVSFLSATSHPPAQAAYLVPFWSSVYEHLAVSASWSFAKSASLSTNVQAFVQTEVFHPSRKIPRNRTSHSDRKGIHISGVNGWH